MLPRPEPFVYLQDNCFMFCFILTHQKISSKTVFPFKYLLDSSKAAVLVAEKVNILILHIKSLFSCNRFLDCHFLYL